MEELNGWILASNGHEHVYGPLREDPLELQQALPPNGSTFGAIKNILWITLHCWSSTDRIVVDQPEYNV